MADLGDPHADLYRLIAENAHDLIALLDEKGILLYVSPASASVLGQAPEALIGTDYYALVHPEDVAAPRATHAAALESLHAVPTYRCRRADGSWVLLESNARGLPGKKVLIVARDVTHRQLIEEQFLQAQKMEAVGRLAGGVAHDFNNLLSIITSAATMLHEDLGADHPSQPMTQEIRDACKRAAELTRQLLAFSRRQMLIPGEVDANELVQSVVESLGTLGPAIRVTTQLDPHAALINVDASQIERVLTHLAVNARDAMPKGGELEFRTSNVSISATDLESTPGTPLGEYVLLEVTDTGSGMDELTRSHLFEPFFTTKPRGKGVGLGLATAYGVVKQSNGYIRVRSTVGKGSSFSLLFPRAGMIAAPPPHPSAPGPIASGTETILLVEDDTAVRRVAAALLEKKGYRVLQAADGQEALKIALAEENQLQLLLTDVMMPGMTGPEIALTLKRKWPNLPVLFMSGYTNDSVLRAGVESASVNFLHKPFTLETLSRRVREVLDQPPDRPISPTEPPRASSPA